jgi:hypothetical protein
LFIGHDEAVDVKWAMPAMMSSIPENKNMIILCCENQTMLGTFASNPANTAPSPKVIRMAGSAQHIRVALEMNRLPAEIKDLRDIFNIVGLHKAYRLEMFSTL